MNKPETTLTDSHDQPEQKTQNNDEITTIKKKNRKSGI